MTQPEKKQRRIFLWVPVVGIKPDRTKFEIDAADPLNATLYYHEGFDKIDDLDMLLVRTQNMLQLLTKVLDPTVKIEIVPDGDGVTVKATGPAEILTALMLGELMGQSFDKDPEKSFWRFVEGAQMTMSTNRLPIRKMYEDFAGEPLHGDHSGYGGGLGPLPKMAKIECSACGIKLEIPEQYAANNPPMHCPNAECKHVGTVKEGKF